MTCFVSVFRHQNVSVQMLIWSQIAGGRRRVCAAHRRVSTMLPVCQREMTLSAGERLTMEATPLQIIRKLCSCISHWEWMGEKVASLFYHPVSRSRSFAIGSGFSFKTLSTGTDFHIIIKFHLKPDTAFIMQQHLYYCDPKKQKCWHVFIRLGGFEESCPTRSPVSGRESRLLCSCHIFLFFSRKTPNSTTAIPKIRKKETSPKNCTSINTLTLTLTSYNLGNVIYHPYS